MKKRRKDGTVSAQNRGFSRNTAPRDELTHCRIWKGKSLTWTKNTNAFNRSDEPRWNTSRRSKYEGKAVITGFHSETSEPEVIQFLKESITEIGVMTIENARIECSAQPITHAFIHFENNDERKTNTSGQRTRLEKNLRGRKLKITRSMDAEERFHQKRMGYVKYCIHVKQHSSRFDNYELDTEAHISQRPDCGKDMSKRKPKVHQIHKTLKQKSKAKWKNGNQKTHRNDCEQSREGSKTKRRRKDYE